MAARRGPNPLLLVLAGVVVLALIAVVISSMGGGDDEPDVAQTASVEIEGEALPPFEAGTDDAAVGTDAPVATGTSFDDSEVVVGEGPAVVVFVAHWCPHCQAEVPVIADWLEENGAPEGADLVAVSTAVDEGAPNFPPSSWLEEEGFDVPVLRDDEGGSVATAFGLTSFPYFVAIDGDGDVVARAAGEIGTDALEQLLDAARSGA